MKIYNEDNLITLARMWPDSIDLTVTSPPYDSLYQTVSKFFHSVGQF